MDVVVADDDGTPTTFRMPVDVDAKQSQLLHGLCPARARASPSSRSGCSIQNGRRVGGASQATVMPHASESIMPDET